MWLAAGIYTSNDMPLLRDIPPCNSNTRRFVICFRAHETAVLLDEKLPQELPYNGTLLHLLLSSNHVRKTRHLPTTICSIVSSYHLADYFEYFGPDFKLHPDIRRMGVKNQNTEEYLQKVCGA